MYIRDRIAARAWVGPNVNPVPIAQAAKPRLLIVDHSTLTHGQQVLHDLRQANPEQKLLLYAIGSSVFPDNTAGPFALRRAFLAMFNLNATWGVLDPTKPAHDPRVRTADGKLLSFGGNFLVNLSDAAPTWQGQRPWWWFAHWTAAWLNSNRDVADGVYYDTMPWTIAWSGANDLNADGVAEDIETTNRWWEAGLDRAVQELRNLAGKDAIVIVNSPNRHWSWADGRFIEYAAGSDTTEAPNEPQLYDSDCGPTGSLDGYIRLYLRWCDRHFCGTASYGPYTVYHMKAGPADYKRFRLGLACALLGNGYSICDDSYTQGRNEVRDYDEYGIDLGTPIEDAVRAAAWWRREYTKAKVYVNPSKTTTVYPQVGTGWRFPKGTQDPAWNTGLAVTSLRLPPMSGAIVVRG